MFTQDDLWRLKTISIDEFPQSKFLIMFLGVIITPLAMIVIGGSDSNIESQFGMLWRFLAIFLFMLAASGIGILMFRSKHDAMKALSISPKVD